MTREPGMRTADEVRELMRQGRLSVDAGLRLLEAFELGLYDPAAQALLHRRPNTDAAQDHIAQLYDGQAYTVCAQGDRAAIVFLHDPDHLLAPWFLRRRPAGWHSTVACIPR